MKRVSHTLTYPDATVHDVFAMFADPAFRKAVSEYQRVIDLFGDVLDDYPGDFATIFTTCGD